MTRVDWTRARWRRLIMNPHWLPVMWPLTVSTSMSGRSGRCWLLPNRLLIFFINKIACSLWEYIVWLFFFVQWLFYLFVCLFIHLSIFFIHDSFLYFYSYIDWLNEWLISITFYANKNNNINLLIHVFILLFIYSLSCWVVIDWLASTWFACPGGMESWVDSGVRWLYTKIVYLLTCSHLPK